MAERRLDLQFALYKESFQTDSLPVCIVCRRALIPENLFPHFRIWHTLEDLNAHVGIDGTAENFRNDYLRWLDEQTQIEFQEAEKTRLEQEAAATAAAGTLKGVHYQLPSGSLINRLVKDIRAVPQ